MKVTTAELASSVANELALLKVRAEGTAVVVKCGGKDVKIRICYDHRKAKYFVDVDSELQLLSRTLFEVVSSVIKMNQS